MILLCLTHVPPLWLPDPPPATGNVGHGWLACCPSPAIAPPDVRGGAHVGKEELAILPHQEQL